MIRCCVGVPLLARLVIVCGVAAVSGCNTILGIGPPALADGGVSGDAGTDAPPTDAGPTDASMDAAAIDAAVDAMPPDAEDVCRFTISNFGQCTFAP